MQLHQLDARVRKILRDLKGYRIRKQVMIENVEIAPRDSKEFAPFENGGLWALNKGDNWYDFRFSVTVPEDFRGQVRLSMLTGMENEWEATHPQVVVWINGRIEQAFDTRHTELVLQNTAKPGEKFDVFMQAYHLGADGVAGLKVARMHLSVIDVMDDVSQLYYDLSVPHAACLMLPDGSRDRETTLRALSDAVNLLDLRVPYSDAFHSSIEKARAFMSENYYQPLENVEPEAVADAIGHTHIDVAWLWDIYQTRHKAVRSFSTMLKLMEQYPEFKFMSSQPQLYQFVKEDQPELFERIKDAVKRGQWEPEGGMWVEADCNLSGGEALVRQFLYGNEFFETEFGKRSRVLWLPDVFGYSAALPQILKKSKIDYFLTSKLSWSEFNLSPYDTFMWKGIDGSEVLTHFTPSRDFENDASSDLAYFTTYNSMLDPSQVKGGWQRFQQKGVDNHFIMSYGYGDGGGGTCEFMIENARRMKNPVAQLPAVRQTFARDFFEQLEKRVEGRKDLPKWSGELYLEYHRGTYTSQGRNKRNNRKLEIALRDAELWLTRAMQAGCAYPQDELREIWRSMLTLQFHDILPGSSIHKVYTDSNETYKDLFERTDKLSAYAMNALMKNAAGDKVFFNSLSHERDDVVWFDAPEGVTHLRNEKGDLFPVQRALGKCVSFVRGLLPMGATHMWYVYGKEETASAVKACEKGFDTPFFKGAFNEMGEIVSLFDKENEREVAKNGQALNKLVHYENRPHNYDAWDINIYYGERSWDMDALTLTEVVSQGPVVSIVRHTYKTSMSEITQDVIFYNDLKRIDFKTHVDWKEPHSLLKAHFPVDVFYNDAQFDIQYGNVKRATHKNTSWDVARFEVCAHKWADVSEPGFGVAIMNDCKYGYGVDENGISLSLVKSATDPDPTADQEEHDFTYSIYPHAGDWREANVPKAAYEFNIPVESKNASGGENKCVAPTFATVDQENVIIETVKGALHGEGAILRMYECFGKRTNVTLTVPAPFKKAVFTSLMEDDETEAHFENNTLKLQMKPYEIVSIRLV